MIQTLGQYKILEAAGVGPLGDVYRARDTRVGRTVTITIVADQIGSDPERRAQFLQRVRAASAVSHPNIVTLYEAAEDGGLLYLVSEFVQGQTLKTLIGGRPLNPRRAVDLASQIAEALADAHAAELVHGALTAESVVVTPKGHAKVIGFGMAPFSERPLEPKPTPASGETEGADLSALGVMLFEMLTGVVPSTGAAIPSAINRSLPREIDPIVAKASSRVGGYEAAATLAAELRAVGAMLDLRQEAYEAGAGIAKPRSAPKTLPLGWIAIGLVLAAIVAWWCFSGA
jgi:serine/threonine protein kinase